MEETGNKEREGVRQGGKEGGWKERERECKEMWEGGREGGREGEGREEGREGGREGENSKRMYVFPDWNPISLTFTCGRGSRPLSILLAEASVISTEQVTRETGVHSRGTQLHPHLDHLAILRELQTITLHNCAYTK